MPHSSDFVTVASGPGFGGFSEFSLPAVEVALRHVACALTVEDFIELGHDGLIADADEGVDMADYPYRYQSLKTSRMALARTKLLRVYVVGLVIIVVLYTSPYFYYELIPQTLKILWLVIWMTTAIVILTVVRWRSRHGKEE